jgi:hypothetical protein
MTLRTQSNKGSGVGAARGLTSHWEPQLRDYGPWKGRDDINGSEEAGHRFVCRENDGTAAQRLVTVSWVKILMKAEGANANGDGNGSTNSTEVNANRDGNGNGNFKSDGNACGSGNAKETPLVIETATQWKRLYNAPLVRGGV